MEGSRLCSVQGAEPYLPEQGELIMAIGENGLKIYSDAEWGIALWELMQVLGYYKRTEEGERDLGMIVENAEINMHAKYKPVEVDTAEELTEEQRAAAGHGIAIYLQAGYDRTGEVDMKYINSIEYVRPTGYARIADFDGYHHRTRSELQLYQDSVNTGTAVHAWTQAHPDGVPLDNSLEQMWKNADPYEQTRIADFSEYGWLALTYSGFVRAQGVMAYTFDELREKLQASSPQATYYPSGFRNEPKGKIGKFLIYGKDNLGFHTQLIDFCRIINSGNVHPIEVIGWTPEMTIGTTTTGFNITYRQWTSGDHKGQYIMFGTDDDLYLGFTIVNNNPKPAQGAAFKLGLTINGVTYYSNLCDDKSSALGGGFTIDPYSSLGVYQYSDGTHIYSRPRFYVQLKSLISILPEFANKQKYDVTFTLYYTEAGFSPMAQRPNYEEGYLVSQFTLPMQCTGKATENPIDPPSDVKPVPPSWDIEI